MGIIGRQPLRGLTPICLVGLPRSGTTLGMRLLSGHPGIVAHDSYPLEFRPFGVAMSPERLELRDHMLRAGFRFEGDRELYLDAVAAGAPMTLGMVGNIYACLAERQGKTPTHFVEKNAALTALRAKAAGLPVATIYLRRDLRDIICSIRSFDRKRNFEGFFLSVGDTPAEQFHKIKDMWERRVRNRPTDAIDVEYADLVTSPLRTLTSIFERLGVDCSNETVSAVVEAVLAVDAAHHRTSSDGEASIGRWRQDFTREEIALARDILGPELTAMGYPLA